MIYSANLGRAMTPDRSRESTDAPAPGAQRFGPYRVLNVVGRGGMGAVYRAVRDDQAYEKQVAIKVLQIGRETAEGVARFRQERQILANLDHPNIARLIDGGDTSDGQPYIVLEYVDGEPISRYCSRHDLPPEARLALFLRVCEAVEYAHRSLVVHRDLKPGNILVTPDGSPKLLDFGIAKLLDPALDYTATMVQAMTPQYASPEQLRGNAVSTVTDVYALGVILYELMTGRHPYKLEGSSTPEIQQIVCQTEPAPPGLGNEIDYVIAKSIRKEPERRYSSVEQLSEDIRRYLNHYPVLARPDSLRYRAGKYARRHHLGLGVVAMLLAAIAVGFAAERRQAQIARERFDLVRGLANRFVFDIYDELAKVPASIEARRKVLETAKEYLDRLSRGAGRDAGFLAELSAAYKRLAMVKGDMAGAGSQLNQEEAVADYEQSLALIRRAAAIDPRHRPALLDLLGFVQEFHRNRKNLTRAAALAAEAVALAEELSRQNPGGGPLFTELRVAYGHAARVYEDLGDAEKMHIALEKTMQFAQREDAESPSAASKHGLELVLSDLSDLYQAAGDVDRALALMSSALEYGRLAQRLDPASRLYARSSARTSGEVAHLSFDVEAPSLRDLDRSIALWEETVREWEIYAHADPQDKLAQLTLGINLTEAAMTLMQRSPERAETLARRGVVIFDGLRADNPKFDQTWGGVWGRARTRLAWILTRTGKSAEARRLTDTALPVLREQHHAAPGQFSTVRALAWGLQVSARVWASLGAVDAGDADYREAVRVIAPGLGKQPADADYWSCMALAHDAGIAVHQRAGNPAKVHEIAGQLVTLWDGWPGSTHWVEMQRQAARQRLAALPR
jgi:tetratricopeptide (TPR) repeat protein/tRNA A-37 threonylcarbamoyl transferase component Bud32